MAIPPVSQWGIGHFLIAIVVIAACVAIMYVALGVYGVAIPAWAITIFWIVVVAIIAVGAIKLVLSLL